jgi:ElaB/YqjD/DUF883 family membrane-anchored ribosome-binding protein
MDFRIPNITGATTHEQMVQVKSYLIQLVEQLNFAMTTVEKEMTKATSQQIQVGTTSSGSGSNGSIDAQATFGAIKSLIIKSADIIAAYSEEISRELSGEYIAQSDFGTYTNNTSQVISETSKGLERVFKNVQTITTDLGTAIDTASKTAQDELDKAKSDLSSDINDLKGSVGGINTTIRGVTANVKSGLLEEVNDIPIYGFEVGQKNVVNGVEKFNKYARFTADRLSFYDDIGKEVAYISDYKLHITDAEIKGNLSMGGYTIYTSNGIAFKWTGRS